MSSMVLKGKQTKQTSKGWAGFKRMPLALAIASAFAVPSVFAQSEPAQEESLEENIAIERIMVTATRVSRSLQEVPVAVTAIDGDTIDNNQIGGVAGLIQLAPSLTFTQSTGDINSRLQIRGVGTGVFSSAVEPSVSFMIDGVVLGRQVQGLQDLVDIEQIEVLRGPQSTLFGKNASAGVISITTKDPSFETEGLVDVLLAQGGEQQLRGTVGTSLNDELGVRLTGFVRERDGHIDNLPDGRDLNGYDTWGFRAKAVYEPSADLTFKFIADYRDAENECCQFTARDFSTAFNPAQASLVLAAMPGITPGPENRETAVGADVFNNSTNAGISGEVNYTLDNGNVFTSITAYRSFEYNNNVDVDGALPDQGTLGVVQINTNSGDTESKQFTQEFRLASPIDRDFSYVLGAFYFNLDLDREFQRRIGAFVPAFNAAISQSVLFEGNAKTTNFSVFGEANYKLTEQLTLLFGARYIDEELKYRAFRDPANRIEPDDFPVGGPGGTLADIDDSVDDTAITGRVGLSYQLSRDFLAYGTFSRGYKGRAFDVAVTVLQDAMPIDAEESNAYELGLKTNLFNDRLTLNTAVFYTEFDNFQAQAPVPGEIAAILVNAGDVETSGVEIEFSALLTADLMLSGGITYANAEISTFPFGPCYAGQTEAQGCIDGSQDLAGGDLPNAPEIKYSVNANYQKELGDSNWEGFANLAYTWQDDVQFSLSQDPLTVQDSYGITNLSLGLTDKDDKYRATVFVKNLFDESYTDNIFRDVLVAGALVQYIPREAERYVGASFRMRF